jgi:hypothetical protein
VPPFGGPRPPPDPAPAAAHRPASPTPPPGRSGSMFPPACVDAAVSVGALYDAAASGSQGWRLLPSGGTCFDSRIYTDALACFTNT